MNITELIVEFVQQGNVVEFPGMGTLTGSNVSAHHDAATGTYYPARRTVTLTGNETGNKAIVRHIADKECVTTDIAEQMWGNYVAALADKLKRDTVGHEFPGLGTLRQQGGRVVFEAIEGLDLDAGKKHEQPLENVATYTPKAAPDPFAAFDMPAAQAAPVAETPAPAPEAVTPAPEPEPTPEPAPVQAAADLSDIKKQLEELPSSADKGKSPRQAAKESAKADKEARKALAEAEKVAAKEAKALEKQQKKESKEAAKAAKMAEKERAAAAKSVAKTSQQSKRESEKAIRDAEKAAAREARAALKAAKKAEKEARKSAAPPRRKEGRAIVWVAVIISLLFVGGIVGYRMYRNHVPETKGTNNAQHIELPPYSRFSRDLAAVDYDEAMIDESRLKVDAFMDEYIRLYLADRHYLNARAVVMDRVDEYANQRLHELMTNDRYTPQHFLTFNDYYYNYCYAELQQVGGYVSRCRVQGELMNAERLDQFLDALIGEMGLHPDGNNGMAAGAAKAATAKDNAPYVENVPPAPTFKASKQGFDIIAGFCTQKSHADKMTNQLKSLGCDAYIINRSGLYYVSMGSASSQTAAEALYNHIKSWYKGDITIKNWND